MTIPTKRLDSLNPTFVPQRDHEVAAMRDGISNKLRIEQIVGLTEAEDVSGLGTMAVQDADSVVVTGGTISGITDLAVADGGTGASTASHARANLGITGYRLRKVTTFTLSGTWTPESYTRLAVLKLQGPGGGGGAADGGGSGVGSAAGGGGGAYVERWLTEGWGETETVTIGAPGAGGTGSSSGGSGGTTSVGTLATANGGGGGQSANRTTTTQRGSEPVGAGGTGSSSGGTSLRDTVLEGGSGSIGASYGSLGVSGAGGDSFLGQGGEVVAEGTPGADGREFGGGGSGGCSNNPNSRGGGDGGGSIVIIEEWE